MSAESLEDGEIASEHEPTPEPQQEVDVADEIEIDRIIENNQSTSSQRVINSPEKKSTDAESSRRRSNNRQSRRKSWKESQGNSSKDRFSRFPQPQPPSLMATSWHPIGNGNNAAGGSGRQPPSESVIFGIQNPNSSSVAAPPSEQYLQPPMPPPPAAVMNQQMMVSPDITRLQNIVNHQPNFYPPPQQQQQQRVPYHFFQSPPDHQMRTPLMSIPMQQQQPPPPHQPHRPLPPLLPHPSPQSFQRLPTPPNPPPSISNNTSWRHVDNYETVDMEMSPKEPPPRQFSAFTRPPIQIPLEPVIAATSTSGSGSSPEAAKSQKAPEDPKTSNPSASEDEATLRAFLLANMNPVGKRPASSSGTPGRADGEPKRIRKNSAPRLSSSVQTIFGAKPVQPPPPVPKIQVNIGKVSEPVAAPEPEPEPAPEVAPVVAPTPTLVETIQQSQLSREEKREQLEKRKLEIEAQFKEQRDKVTDAAKNSKVAATMAAKAEELAKQAERMNQEAVELRQKCIESTRVGKEEMRKILIEKRELQTAIDEMSIDDMEEIDVEEFPCIFFASVKPTSDLKDEKPALRKVEPVSPQVVAPAQSSTAPGASISSLTTSKALESTPVAPAVSAQKSTASVASSSSLSAARAPQSSPRSSAAPARTLTAPVAPARSLTAPLPLAQDLTPPRAPRASEPAREQRQAGGRCPTEEMEQLVRNQQEELQIAVEESENEHDQSDDTEEDKMEHVEDEEGEEAEQSVEGEDEYETEEEVEVEEVSPVPVSPMFSPLKPSAKEVPQFSRKMEEEMRARLLNKFTKNDVPRTSPDAEKVSSSSQNAEEHAEECRAVLQRMCKFELNGKCERPRDCHFLHLHNINDTKQQTQILESLFRDVFQYQEADIAGAVAQTMHFLPEFRAFEKLMDQFFRVVVQQTPDFKPRLFQFFAQVRR